VFSLDRPRWLFARVPVSIGGGRRICHIDDDYGRSRCVCGIYEVEPTNIIAGAFTFYLVATAWLTVTRKEKETGRIEFGLLLVGLAAGITSLTSAGKQRIARRAPTLEIPSRSTFLAQWLYFQPPGHSHAHSRGVAGAKRLVRHLWRMCIALFIAAGSFFLEQPAIQCSGNRDCAPHCSPQQFARHTSLKCRYL